MRSAVPDWLTHPDPKRQADLGTEASWFLLAPRSVPFTGIDILPTNKHAPLDGADAKRIADLP